jgi:hypothetical protein
MLLTIVHNNVNLVNDHKILKCGREDIGEVTLHNLDSCALWWHRIDRWVFNYFHNREHMWRKSPRHMVKTLTGRTPRLMAKLSMLVAAEKPMDGESLSVFLILWMQVTIHYSYYYLFLWRFAMFPEVLDSRHARPLRVSSSACSPSFSPRISQGFTCAEGGGAAQTYATSASPSESN